MATIKRKAEATDIYGVPRLYMAGVRSSDMKRTPDIRTRAILPEWACRVSVKYAMPALTHQAVANLLASGGMCSGIGDGRVEKGHLNFGLFRVASSGRGGAARPCGRSRGRQPSGPRWPGSRRVGRGSRRRRGCRCRRRA